MSKSDNLLIILPDWLVRPSKQIKRLAILLAIVTVTIAILAIYYEPRLHNHDRTNACGVQVGGLGPLNSKPPNRICHCDGSISTSDYTPIDGDRLEYCLGNGWSILNR